MEIPGLGTMTKDEEFKHFNWHFSAPLSIPVLGGFMLRVGVEEYERDPRKEEFHAAIANFLAAGPEVLKASEKHIFRYYQQVKERAEPGEEIISIASPTDVWKHVEFESYAMTRRRPYAWGDQGVYITLDSWCGWEEEHGLQIVFKNGLAINKVGPFDGHLTNEDAYGEEGLEDVVYREF
jgi:hypothetical protein